jgi:hypothetical protein
VLLDGSATTGNAYDSPQKFQQLLFSQDDLHDGPHELVLQDVSTQPKSRPGMDVDFIIFTTGDPSAGYAAKI